MSKTATADSPLIQKGLAFIELQEKANAAYDEFLTAQGHTVAVALPPQLVIQYRTAVGRLESNISTML